MIEAHVIGECEDMVLRWAAAHDVRAGEIVARAIIFYDWVMRHQVEGNKFYVRTRGHLEEVWVK